METEEIFKRFAGTSLPEKQGESPKTEYHLFADGVYWSDEGLDSIDSDLEDVFREVINYRTDLLTSDSISNCKRAYELAKHYFPSWVGFIESRNSFNPEIADRIRRIRKVSNKKIDKFFSNDDFVL